MHDKKLILDEFSLLIRIFELPEARGLDAFSCFGDVHELHGLGLIINERVIDSESLEAKANLLELDIFTVALESVDLDWGEVIRGHRC